MGKKELITGGNIWGNIWKNKNHNGKKRDPFGAVDPRVRLHQLPERVGYASSVEAIHRYEHPAEEDEQRVGHLPMPSSFMAARSATIE